MSIVPHTRQPAAAVDVPFEARHRWVALLGEAAELSHAIANTDFVPKTLRGNEAAIAAAILYGDEVGLSPMQSLAKIAVIDGKPSIAAEAQRALILAAGHFMWPEEMGTTKVTWNGARRETPDNVTRVTWTMDDARKANLAGKHNWRLYPRAMLSARASAELARAIFADVIGGLAASEELEDVTDATVAPEPASSPDPPPATTRRRRATKAPAPAVAPVPPPPPDPAEPPLPDEAPPARANDAQLRKMFALFNERGIADRDARLDWTNARLERTVLSASELTDAEASLVITALEEMATEAEEAPPDLPPEEPPAADQQALGEPTITADRAGILLHMAREANAPADWLRTKLTAFGIELGADERIGQAVMQRLTRPQAIALQESLNELLDAQLTDE
jgi:hypothetical protein